ncbi:MAG: hypothetical protein RIF33_14550 [Cyclobacteriaceae bacterium]
MSSMRFAHTNIVSSNWKELADFYVKTFNCKIVPPLRKQSGDWLDKGTGLKNANLEGAHLLLPVMALMGRHLRSTNTKSLTNEPLHYPIHRALDILPLKSRMCNMYWKTSSKMVGKPLERSQKEK